MSMFDFLQPTESAGRSSRPAVGASFFGGDEDGGALHGAGGGSPAVLSRLFEHYADGPTCNENDKDNEPPPAAPPQVECDPNGDASVCPTDPEPEGESENPLPEMIDAGHTAHEIWEVISHFMLDKTLGLGPMPFFFPKMPSLHPEPEGA
jgi:hypothetical protein